MMPEELLTILTSAVREGGEVSLSIFASDCDVDAGVDIRTPTDVLTRLVERRGDIRYSAYDDSAAALMIDVTDEVTGLIGRESWVFLVSGGFVSQVLHAWCFLAQERAAFTRREVDPFLRIFGFRAVWPKDYDVVREAQRAVSEAAGRPAEFSYDDALISDDLIYVPFTWIGCCGFLVVRASGKAILLGGAIDVPTHVWAYYRGFADGETSADRLNDLVITSIRDKVETRKALRTRFRVLPDFKNLPVCLRSVDLYFLRRQLLEAELRDWFRFEVAPPTDAA